MKFKDTEYGDLTGQTYDDTIDCRDKRLTSLEGAPQKVGGYFVCSTNQLTSLEGGPREVGGGFNCDSNQLTSLEGAPKKVGGYFVCSANQLTSLEGAPQKVGYGFDCNNNQLTSLKGAPQKIGGYFDCNNNQLTSLEGAPKEVGGNFYCRQNVNLHSLWPLKYCQIGGTIVCDDRLQYQIPLLKSCETEDEFAVQAYLGTDDGLIRKYFADNYDSAAVYVVIDEIF
jgi:hypothetical protein